jgi:hypothetical protein
MKQATTGKCSRCGAEGLVWGPHLKTLDFGVGAPMEPKAVNLAGPLCDDCEELTPERVAVYRYLGCAPPRTHFGDTSSPPTTSTQDDDA